MRISDWSSDVCSSDLFVGSEAGDNIVVSYSSLAAAATEFTATGIGLVATAIRANVATMTAAESAMSLVDGALDVISDARAHAVGLVSRFQFRSLHLSTHPETTDADNTTLMDLDLPAAPNQTG